MIYQGLDKVADHVGDRAIADQVGIFMSLGAFLVFYCWLCGCACGSTWPRFAP